MPDRRRPPQLRYRCPADWGQPPLGAIFMGDGPRVRRGYRVLSAFKIRGWAPALGVSAWRIRVEPMSAASARAEIESGLPHWPLQWDKRAKVARRDA